MAFDLTVNRKTVSVDAVCVFREPSSQTLPR